MSKTLGQCQKCSKTMKEGFFIAPEDTPDRHNKRICAHCGLRKSSSERKIDEVEINKIKLTTVGIIPENMEIMGIVTGSTVRAKNNFKDFGASIQSAFGGEVSVYTSLVEEARLEALQRCRVNAFQMGASMIVEVRFTSTTVEAGVSEITAYGTALKRRSDTDFDDNV